MGIFFKENNKSLIVLIWNTKCNRSLNCRHVLHENYLPDLKETCYYYYLLEYIMLDKRKILINTILKMCHENKILDETYIHVGRGNLKSWLIDIFSCFFSYYFGPFERWDFMSSLLISDKKHSCKDNLFILFISCIHLLLSQSNFTLLHQNSTI